ncbi:MAG TPA: TetR/AcrR family transcriptional regulator [Ktedonobacteraceae bacterium]
MAGNTSWEEEGRINQKRRTRAAVLEAAKHLLREGQMPSVAEVADVACVSRATAYRYFPTQEYLLSEAALESARTDINHLLERSMPSNDPAGRLDTTVQALQQVTLEQEAAFRTLLQLSLEAHATGGQKREATDERLRGGRRIGWIEQALSPLGISFDKDPALFRRVVAALSLCVGIEALIVLQDVCGLEAAEAVEVSRWAAQALLQAGLREATAFSPQPPAAIQPELDRAEDVNPGSSIG